MGFFLLSFSIGCLSTLVILIFIARRIWRHLQKLAFRHPVYYPHVPVAPESPMPPAKHNKKSSFGKTLVIYVTVTLILVRVAIHHFGYEPNNSAHKQDQRITEPIEQVVDLAQESFPLVLNRDQ